MNDIRLIHGDCLNVMQDIADGSVDMVLTDPPYSSGGLFAGDRKKSTHTKYLNTKHTGAAVLPDFSGDNMDQRSFVEFMRIILSRARIKTKSEGICAVFVDWRNLPAMTDAMQWAGWVWRGIVVWDKGTARNIPGRFRPDCEYIICGTNGARSVDWDKGTSALPGCYHIPSVPSIKRQHQTEKPIDLMEKLLRISPSDATILDLFMGSGTTGVACTNTGRKFIGIELSRYYFEMAKQRIEKASMEVQTNE